MENDLKMVGARVEPDFKYEIRVEAAKRGLTVNDFIITAIRYYIKETPARPVPDIQERES